MNTLIIIVIVLTILIIPLLVWFEFANDETTKKDAFNYSVKSVLFWVLPMLLVFYMFY